MRPTIKQFSGTITRTTPSPSEATAIITTPSVDLQGDTIDPTGIDVRGYLAGPGAVLFSHDNHRLPVGKTLALDVRPSGITARWRWLENDPDAARVRNAFDQGVLAASVGLVATEATPTRTGYHISRSVLSEFSLTSTPANPECLALLKSLRGPAEPWTLELADEPLTLELADEPVRRRIAQGFLEIEDDPNLLDLPMEPKEIAAAIAEVIGDRVRAALTQLTGRLD